jgi:uncharacterized protein (DUF58 family)
MIPNPSAAQRARTQRGEPRVRRRYEFGRGGLLYVGITLLIALGAFNSQNNLLYWTFGFALALLLVSGVLSGAMLMGLRVEREWISSAAAGEIVRIRYQVRNINRLIPTFALTIVEEGFDEPVARPRPWYLRVLGFKPLPPGPEPILTTPRTFVAHVGAGETVHAESRAVARRRGAATFSGFIVSTSFPFGLLGKSIHVPRHAATVVMPRPVEIEFDPAGASARSGHMGGNSRRSGRGEEFFALREYVHGDSPRDVAWRASAKRGSLLVRQFAAPSPQRLWIVLHLRTRAGSTAADEQAIRIVAGLARQAEQRGVEYALAVPLTRLLMHPRRGEGHLTRLMTDLGLLDLGPDDGRGARAAFPPQATGGGAGSSCVVVHSGALDMQFAPASSDVTNIVASAPAAAGTPAATASPTPQREGASRAA